MKLAEKFYRTYETLYSLIMVWAAEYIPADHAHQVARFAIADAAESAKHGYSTDDGPFALVKEFATRHMNTRKSMWAKVEGDGPIYSFPGASKELLLELCDLYAAFYEVSYLAASEGWQVDHIIASLRMFGPQPGMAEEARAGLAYGICPRDHLTQAVLAMESHVQGEFLICCLAETIRADEGRKSVAWHQRFTWVEGEI